MAPILQLIKDHLEMLPKVDVLSSHFYSFAVGTVAVLVTGKIVSSVYGRYSFNSKLKKKQAEIQSRKIKLLQKLVGLKTPMENVKTIPNLSLAELQTKISSGELKIIDVLEAYQAKALTVDQDLKCLTEPIYDADVQAIYLDSKYASSSKGLLHGIPISIKDMCAVQGYDATFGLVQRALMPEQEDCVLVKVLRQQGGIPFVLTNMSQMGMAIDSNNPLFGETVNPYNRRRTPGGSSGGEGSLLGANGSILGIGTDIGGSIRIPAHHCGVCGLKPTVDRLSMAGIPDPCPVYTVIRCAVGPLARDVESLVLCMRALLTDKMYSLDARIPPMPFNEELFNEKRPLKIGYYTTLDGIAPRAVPAVQRALLMAKEVLEARGHTLVPFALPDFETGAILAVSSFFLDGGRTLANTINKEKLSPSIKFLTLLINLPRSFKRLLACVLNRFNRTLGAGIESVTGCGSVNDSLVFCERVEKYKALMARRWQEEGIDALICPAHPFPAPPHDAHMYTTPAVLYTCIYNLIDYPAGVVPVTKVIQEDVSRIATDYPTDFNHRPIAEFQSGSEGLPVGVQCVAMQWREEIALRVMLEVQNGLKTV